MDMSRETKTWWEYNAQNYQKKCKIPIDIHYGPGSPNEKNLKLLGNIEGKNILEIGCGGAQCGIAMAKQKAIVTGMDISNEQLEFAKCLAEENKVKITLQQGDISNLRKIKSNSQDIIFSAWALQYVSDLGKCFKEVYRVLRKNGIFVFSFGHRLHEIINPKTRKITTSYFDIGRYTEREKGHLFVMYTRNIGEIVDVLVEAGFNVERIIEPDSRKNYPYDPWKNLWNYKKMKNWVPLTIIFKARKIK
jgi:ubiquinone/menaquinone biosynthesis C-methylase UbiE